MNLCHFLDYCEEDKTTIERAEPFNRFLLRYVHYVFDDFSSDSWVQASKV